MLLAGAVAVEVGSMLLHDLLCMAEITSGKKKADGLECFFCKGYHRKGKE